MVIIEALKGTPITGHRIEVVERKGTGHPDYMCDSIMEAISVALAKEYTREFGAVLHYNIDKGLLAAGQVKCTFGGGRVVKPMELTIGDRATFSAAGKRIPVAEIAVNAAKQWVRDNLRFVNPEKHLKFRVVLAPGSAELSDIFLRPGKVRTANDTSAAVGYYPLSAAEKAVLELERYINSKEFKSMFPETGEDVKIMGLREEKELSLIVAMPFLAQYIASESEYFARKDLVLRNMMEFTGRFSEFRQVSIHFNALDNAGRGLGGVYLSLLGTSAENADSGQVGRGNRVNGLISMNRPMGTEAAAGKNPFSHVGKIYNVLAHKIAKEICRKVEGVQEAYVFLLSRIGAPVDRPELAAAQVSLERGRKVNEIAGAVKALFAKQFSETGRFCIDLSRGKYPVC